MSIAAISSSFIAAVRGSAPVVPVEPVAPTRAQQRSEQAGGRRHELVDTMSQALGVEGEQSKSAEQAVFRFAQALMHDLRSVDAGGQADPGNGNGHAWGRRDWSDLPQRVDALATAVRAAAGEPVAPALPGATPPQDTPIDAPLADLPPLPNPLTATSAAVHLMQVPSSRLLEAYTALRQALSEQSPAPAANAGGDDLAAFLARLSSQLSPDAPVALPSGSVVNVTA